MPEWGRRSPALGNGPNAPIAMAAGGPGGSPHGYSLPPLPGSSSTGSSGATPGPVRPPPGYGGPPNGGPPPVGPPSGGPPRSKRWLLWVLLPVVIGGGVAAAVIALQNRGTPGGPDASRPDAFGAAPLADAAKTAPNVDARSPSIDAPSPDALRSIDAPAAIDAARAAGDSAIADAIPRPEPGTAIDAAAPQLPSDAEPAAATPPDASPSPPPPGGESIVFDEPQVMTGNIPLEPLLQALAQVRPELDACRLERKDTHVRVQFTIGSGKLNIARPAAYNPGDANAARCVADRVKAAKPFWPGNLSGIVEIEVTLPAKAP